jgi:hypothetical protein
MILLAVSLLLIPAGCDRASMMRKLTPPEAESAARNYVNLLRQHKFEQIEKNLDPNIEDPATDDKFAQMAAIFPAGEPLSTKVVGLNVIHGPGATTTSIVLEYEFPGKWLLANVVTKRTADATSITGFFVNPMSDSLENQNRFMLTGKGAVQYALLLLAVFDPLFCLYAFVMCIRAKIEKWKWLWLIVTLVGAGALNLNWTTGQASFTLSSIYLLSAAVNAAPYGPWILHVSLPLGAMLFLSLRNNLEKSNSHPLEPLIPSPLTSPSSHPTRPQNTSG